LTVDNIVWATFGLVTILAATVVVAGCLDYRVNAFPTIWTHAPVNDVPDHLVSLIEKRSSRERRVLVVALLGKGRSSVQPLLLRPHHYPQAAKASTGAQA
jgi:hypothetical protein